MIPFTGARKAAGQMEEKQNAAPDYKVAPPQGQGKFSLGRRGLMGLKFKAHRGSTRIRRGIPLPLGAGNGAVRPALPRDAPGFRRLLGGGTPAPPAARAFSRGGRSQGKKGCGLRPFAAKAPFANRDPSEPPARALWGGKTGRGVLAGASSSQHFTSYRGIIPVKRENVKKNHRFEKKYSQIS